MIFGLLYNKAKSGVRVELLLTDDKINDKHREAHERLRSVGGVITSVGSKNATSTMHNKFCVIDTSTIITGSYNWSNQAQRNDENITVIYDANDLASQFS